MKDFRLTSHNLGVLFDELQNELKESGSLIVSSQNASTGKWGMARLWRAWMSSTAKFMAENGVTMPLITTTVKVAEKGLYNQALFKLREMLGNGHNLTITYGTRPFDANDAHELFTRQWLGVDEDGARLSWAKSGDQRKATKGERYLAMFKHEIWATERGIILFNPRSSEYSMLESKMNE